MKIAGVNNHINTIKPEKSVSRPTFRSAQSAEHYAIELMQINNSEAARELISHSKKLLPVKAIREFIADFLQGVKNSKGISEYTKERILQELNYNFNDFVYKDGYFFRTVEEELNSHKPKCSYADIADNEGNITEGAFDAAKHLAKQRGSNNYLPDYLKGAKDANGRIDSYIGYLVAELVERLGDWDTLKVMKYRIYRDEKGNVNRDLLDKIYYAPENKTWYVINHYGLKTEEDVFKEYEKENLYLPQNFYKLLQSLNENRLIYSNEASIMYKEIGDYGKLLFILPDIPRSEENKDAYDKIIRFLSSNNTYKYDFNLKDQNGISFMEKVINSENKELVNMINKMQKKDLIYYPELDWAYKGIQDEEFKKEVDKLDFKFENTEKAAQLRSTRALAKVAPQLDSPLCKKTEMIVKLWNIAKSQSQGVDSLHDFGKYLCDTYWEDLPENILFSILESIKR